MIGVRHIRRGGGLRRLCRRGLLPVAMAAILIAGCGAAGTMECAIVQTPVNLPQGADESSGVVVSRTFPGTLWTHNDSGGEAELFAVQGDGQLIGRVGITGATLVDWEDLAISECAVGSCLYIAETGDNQARRERVGIYRIPEPDPRASASEPAIFLPVRYPQGPRDAEALFVLPGEQIFLVSKGRVGDVELFRYPPPLRPGETVTLEQVRTLAEGPVPLEEQVTGAGASPSGDWVAIRSYKRLRIWPTAALLNDGVPSLIADLSPLGEVQGEAVALLDNGAVTLTSEGGFPAAPGTLSLLECPLATSAR